MSCTNNIKGFSFSILSTNFLLLKQNLLDLITFILRFSIYKDYLKEKKSLTNKFSDQYQSQLFHSPHRLSLILIGLL